MVYCFCRTFNIHSEAKVLMGTSNDSDWFFSPIAHPLKAEPRPHACRSWMVCSLKAICYIKQRFPQNTSKKEDHKKAEPFNFLQKLNWLHTIEKSYYPWSGNWHLWLGASKSWRFPASRISVVDILHILAYEKPSLVKVLPDLSEAMPRQQKYQNPQAAREKEGDEEKHRDGGHRGKRVWAFQPRSNFSS